MKAGRHESERSFCLVLEGGIFLFCSFSVRLCVYIESEAAGFRSYIPSASVCPPSLPLSHSAFSLLTSSILLSLNLYLYHQTMLINPFSPFSLFLSLPFFFSSFFSFPPLSFNVFFSFSLYPLLSLIIPR